MSRGFSYYYEKGSQLTKLVFARQGFKSKLLYSFYLFASLLGKLFIFTYPVFALADENIACMVVNGRSFSLEKAFDGINAQKYVSLLVSTLAIHTIVYAMLILCCIPATVGVSMFQALREDISRFTYPQVIMTVLACLVAGVIFIVFLFMFLVHYRGRAYVAHKNSILTAGDVMYNSKTSTKGHRGFVYGTDILEVVMFAIPGLCFLLGYLMMYVLGNGTGLFQVIAYIPVVLGYVLYLFVTTSLVFKLNIARYLFHKDVFVTAKRLVVKEVEGAEPSYEEVFTDDKELVEKYETEKKENH